MSGLFCMNESINERLISILLRLQGELTKTLTKLYDGLVDNLRTILQLICPEKALAKPLLKNFQWLILQLFSKENLACVTLNKFRKSVKQLLHL